MSMTTVQESLAVAPTGTLMLSWWWWATRTGGRERSTWVRLASTSWSSSYTGQYQDNGSLVGESEDSAGYLKGSSTKKISIA